MKQNREELSQIKGILLWGGKSKARVAIEMLREAGFGGPKLIYDSAITETSFPHKAYFTNDIQTLKRRLAEVSHYVVCVGAEHGFARVKIAEHLDRLGLRPISLIHATAFIEETSVLGVGCQVMPSAVVHKFSIVGNHTIINTNATIDHECIVGDGVHIMGSAAVAGKIVIGNFATIGTNATVLPFLSIGEGAYVGAGAVVTKNVEPYTVVAGIPAKKIRDNAPTVHAEPLDGLLEGPPGL